MSMAGYQTALPRNRTPERTQGLVDGLVARPISVLRYGVLKCSLVLGTSSLRRLPCCETPRLLPYRTPRGPARGLTSRVRGSNSPCRSEDFTGPPVHQYLLGSSVVTSGNRDSNPVRMVPNQSCVPLHYIPLLRTSRIRRGLRVAVRTQEAKILSPVVPVVTVLVLYLQC